MEISEIRKGSPILIPKEFFKKQEKEQHLIGKPIKWDPAKAQKETDAILASRK